MPPRPRKTASNDFGVGIFHQKPPLTTQQAVEFPYPRGFPHDRPIEASDYFKQCLIWLDLEADAERARMAHRRQMRNQSNVEQSGEAILGLELVDHHTGLAGRFLLDLAKPGGLPLPMTRLKVGSPIVLASDDDPSDEGISGVVSMRKSHVIQIATDHFPDSNHSSPRGVGKHGKTKAKSLDATRFRLDLSPDETTRRRQVIAMNKVQGQRGRSGRLRDVLLTQSAPRFDGVGIDQVGVSPIRVGEELSDIRFQTQLNPPQREAVAFALMADDVAIIHGPPGTGKTTTIAEVILQAVLRGDRVLACAASNAAVDNLVERLVDLMPHVVRLGHPARVSEALQEHTLDALVEADPSSKVLIELRRELEQTLRKATRDADTAESRQRRSELFQDAGQLRGQIRGLERSIIRGVLDRSDVICTTTTIDDELLGDDRFDLVVIDEACQCTEPGIWQAVLRGDRLVLAGDHCQLPPTVLSDQATAAGMRDSLMHRLVNRYGDRVFRRLTVQYRMHEAIMRFSSDHFYESSLIADVSVRGHLLSDLEHVTANDLTSRPLDLFDTAGAGYEEELEPGGESKLNHGEASVIIALVRRLTQAGVHGKQIAIIAPYAAQVRCLKLRLDLPGIKIDTVDGFQGRERDVVLLTMVRSNPRGEIGFLADRRRSNVAMTRARRKLILVGDSATLGGHEFYAAVLDYFEQANAYRSVFEINDAVEAD